MLSARDWAALSTSAWVLYGTPTLVMGAPLNTPARLAGDVAVDAVWAPAEAEPTRDCLALGSQPRTWICDTWSADDTTARRRSSWAPMVSCRGLLVFWRSPAPGAVLDGLGLRKC